MRAALDQDLSVFHPIIADWFGRRFGQPTEIQRLTWPRVAAGEHVLVTAPTGSGKTLTAFLWALDRLLTGAWEGGRLRVLYVSPLKALNNDIQRNLLQPLKELDSAFRAAEERVEPVRVATRSGDTPSSERQRMLRHPPEILITTPESLNILLTSKGGRSLLCGLETVILDEIHAVAASKRGVHLMTAVERLVPLSGEFQRVALSATIRPLERIASFVGGRELVRGSEEESDGVYRARPVSIARSKEEKKYALEVVAAAISEGAGGADGAKGGATSNQTGPIVGRPARQFADDEQWQSLVGEFRRAIGGNRSTLVFANSRRATEKLTRLLNDGEAGELAYSHHGSLSREIRSVVEKRLKTGELAAIVATNSLELGIDIGSLDEVLLLQTPPTVASAVQRIGRSGHGVGETSRARLFPFFDRDFLDAAVMARSVLDQDLESVEPIRAPLDVLAQVILSLVATEPWKIENLFDLVRCADPYRELPRLQFDLVLDMLAGRYADSRIRELQPQVSIDRLDGTVRGRRGAAHRVYFGGGTIPDRGYFQLRVEESGARLGELDEEFVWERSVGDTFSLGAQTWRVQKITSKDVFVVPAYRSAAMAPFWRAEARSRSFHLSERIGGFLERAEAFLGSRRGAIELGKLLTESYCLNQEAAARLIGLLQEQRAETGSGLPHRHRLLIERVREERAGPGREHVILHTFWGARVNRPLIIAIAAAWSDRFAYPLEIDCENDCIILTVADEFQVEQLWELVRPDNLEELLRRRLESTGVFGARFRENAGRALLLPRSSPTRRVPLWLQRERSKKLLSSVRRYDDFPIVAETWRSCLQDVFDLESLKLVLGELESGEIRVEETRTEKASPFAANLIWQQTNRLMYEDDVPEDSTGVSVRPELLQEVVHSSSLRPRLPIDLIESFEEKLQRLAPGYAPRTAGELVDWVQERVLLPWDDWGRLLGAIERDSGESPQEMVDGASERIFQLDLPLAGGAGADDTVRTVCSLENAPRVLRAFGVPFEGVQLTSLHSPGAPEPETRVRLEANFQQVFGRDLHDQQEGSTERTQGDLESSQDAEAQLVSLLGEWLRFYGPIEPQQLRQALGLLLETVDRVLASLADDDLIVLDRFREGSEQPLEACDVVNLERLLRLLRARSRPIFKPLAMDQLPLFLATHQGLAARHDGIEGLQTALDRLLMFPAPARLWESELLPARLDPYYPAWLDSLLLESDLRWLGCGNEKTTFLFPADEELLGGESAEGTAEPDIEEATAPAAPAELAEMFSKKDGASLSFEELLVTSRLDSAELGRRLWQAVWQGRVSNSTYGVLRRGLLSRFKPEPVGSKSKTPTGGAALGRRRARFDRWRSSRPSGGEWYLREPVEGHADALEIEELNRERARVLLDRYGVVFRELLDRELGPFRWGRLFRSLRLMELSGEVYSGLFFDGVPGPQFTTPEVFRTLSEGLAQDSIFWMNAMDPASPAGIGIYRSEATLPARRPSNHLVFHGSRLVVVSQRRGAELAVEVEPDHPHLPDYFEFFKVLMTRSFDPVKSITIETVNGNAAANSPFGTVLRELFATTSEQGSIRLRRRY